MDGTLSDDVGEIFKDIGGFGIYQKFLCIVVVGVTNGLCALSFATQLFSVITPDHWCWNKHVAALQEQLPLAEEDTKKFTLPLASTGRLPWSDAHSVQSFPVFFSQCQRYDGDLVWAYIGWIAAKSPPYHIPVNPTSGKNYTVCECDQGWVYNDTFQTLTTENAWVCKSNWKPYALHTAFWLGVLFSVCFNRYFSNRFGRRPTLLTGILLSSFGGAIALFSSNFIPLIASRFIIGLGHFVSSYLALLLVMELCDEQHKIFPMIAMMVSHAIATLAAPWMAHGTASWWWLTLIITIMSAAVCFILAWIVPESPWWMSIKDKHDDSVRLLKRIAAVNRKQTPKLLEESCDLWSKRHMNKLWPCCYRRSSKNNLLEFEKIQCHNCRKLSVILNTLWVLCYMCYYGNYYTSMSLMSTALGVRTNISDNFTSYWYSALVEMPAWLLPFVLQGRPRVHQITLLATLTSAAILGFCYTLLPPGYIISSLTMGLMNRFAVTVAYYTSVQRYLENNDFYKINSAGIENAIVLAITTVPVIIYAQEYYIQLPAFFFSLAASSAAILSMFIPTHLANEQKQNTSLSWIIQWLQLKRFRKFSITSTENKEVENVMDSSVPYSPLECT